MDFIIPVAAFLLFYFLFNVILSLIGLIDGYCTYLAGILQVKLNAMVDDDKEEEVHTECIGFQVPSPTDTPDDDEF